MVKITFIYPDVLLHRPDWTGYFYVGLGSLSAVLTREGFKTSLIHITKPPVRSTFIRRLTMEKPDLIGFSSSSPMFPLVRQLTGWIREERIEVPIICGGIHPTIAPEETLATEGIDLICRGEGKAPLVEVCRRLECGQDLSGIRNLWIKKEGFIERNPLRPLIENLDTLPFPDRALFDYQNLYAERQGTLIAVASRGCPYNCAYCCNHLLRKIYGREGQRVRFRSVDHVVAELQLAIKAYPFIRRVAFDDDILFLNRKWAEHFAERYSTEIRLPFICNARPNLMNESTADLLKKAGCAHVKLGLESGNHYISNSVLNRQLTNDQIKNAVAFCKERGLITESFNMVGIPFETPSSILDTIKLNAMIGVDKMQVSVYQPYQGTKLAERCKDNGFVVAKDLKSDWFAPTLRLNTISSRQVLMFRDYFKVLVRFYQLLMKLPGAASKHSIRLADKVLSLQIISWLLNCLYVPLNVVYRTLLRAYLNARSSRMKHLHAVRLERRNCSRAGAR